MVLKLKLKHLNKIVKKKDTAEVELVNLKTELMNFP